MHHLNVKLDEELVTALQVRARELGESISSVVRDLLRRGLGAARGPREAGFITGRQEGYAAVRKAVEEAIAQVPPAPPGK